MPDEQNGKRSTNNGVPTYLPALTVTFSWQRYLVMSPV